MSPKQQVRKRRLWPWALAALFALGALDSTRRPQDQVTAQIYVAAVRVYQWLGRPVVRPFCTCRFLPTCSEYSAEAVQTHGIRYGLYLTARRLLRCDGSVPLGTWDPVPPPDEWK